MRSPPMRSPPTRSPPSARSIQNPFSSSPTGFALLSHSFDPIEHSRTTRSSPSLPPGFGPPRSISNQAASKAPANVTRDRAERRIARGPDISANFATRIAYANQHTLIRASNPSAESSRIRPHRIQSTLHDLGLSSEIDRLFADDGSAQPCDESKDSQLAPRYMPRLDSEAPRLVGEQSHAETETQSVIPRDFGIADAADESDETDAADEDVLSDSLVRPGATQIQTETHEDVEKPEIQQLSESVTRDNHQNMRNIEKIDSQESSVAALAKWFSSLAAAVDVVEHNVAVTDKAPVARQADVRSSESSAELGGEKCAVRKQVDRWMESMWDRALRDDVDSYFEEGLEQIPLSFAVDDLIDVGSNVSGVSRRGIVGAPSVRTDDADLDKMMSHLSSAV